MHVAAIDDGEEEIGEEEKTGEEDAKVIGIHTLYAIVSAKRDLAHAFNFLNVLYMHIAFYALRIGVSKVSVMEI